MCVGTPGRGGGTTEMCTGAQSRSFQGRGGGGSKERGTGFYAKMPPSGNLKQRTGAGVTIIVIVEICIDNLFGSS